MAGSIPVVSKSITMMGRWLKSLLMRFPPQHVPCCHYRPNDVGDRERTAAGKTEPLVEVRVVVQIPKTPRGPENHRLPMATFDDLVQKKFADIHPDGDA